jgi:hypothetical protein
MKNKLLLIIAFLFCGWVFYAAFKGNGKSVESTANEVDGTKAQDKGQCKETENATGEFSIINLLFSLTK